MTIGAVLRALTPATARWRLKRSLFPLLGRHIEWEYARDGWDAAERRLRVRGWNARAVGEAYTRSLDEFTRRLEGRGPLGFWYEGGVTGADDLVVPHNIYMSYAYAFARASHGLNRVRMLDWGGAGGHYFTLTRALFPAIELDYVCKETMEVAEHLPNRPHLTVTADEQCLDRCYDFVVVSSSLHYEKQWRTLLGRLALATGGYLYVTRLPVVQKAASFVFIQRPYDAGYNTEYLGWCLNREEWFAAVRDCGLTLVREFVLGENPEIDFAPEPNQYRGYLLVRSDEVSTLEGGQP